MIRSEDNEGSVSVVFPGGGNPLKWSICRGVVVDQVDVPGRQIPWPLMLSSLASDWHCVYPTEIPWQCCSSNSAQMNIAFCCRLYATPLPRYLLLIFGVGCSCSWREISSGTKIHMNIVVANQYVSCRALWTVRVVAVVLVWVWTSVLLRTVGGRGQNASPSLCSLVLWWSDVVVKSGVWTCLPVVVASTRR